MTKDARIHREITKSGDRKFAERTTLLRFTHKEMYCRVDWLRGIVKVCVGVATRPGLCQIAKDTASAAPMLCTEYGPNG